MREDAYIQINKWEGCAMYNRDGEKEEFAVQAETQHSSKGSAQRSTEEHVPFGKYSSCSPSPLHLQLRCIWHWLDMRVLQEWQLFHSI